jgi:hypothetical protein
VGFLERRRRRNERLRSVEAELDRARDEIARLITEESAARAEELKLVIAREQADARSKLLVEERRIAEERRRAVVAEEEQSIARLTAGLAEAQRRIEQRLSDWAADLERTQQSLGAELAKLRERQAVLIAEAEERIQADREKIDESAELQAIAVGRLREELERAAKAAADSMRTDLEAHAAEGRRALEELNERLKARDKRIAERVEREETDVVKRIQARFVDVERRQLESLERATNQASGRFAEAAALQFDAAVKTAREDAARRLARELDRAVHMFAREAESVLAERLAQVADQGTHRVEKRLRQVTAGLERQRDEFIGALQRRLSQLELELRERMRTIAEEAESERAVLDQRLQEIARRAEESVPAARR